jgi:cobyrinic acid a,c-diamide synthase
LHTCLLPPRVIIAAPASGSGKTTVSAGLIAALVARGLRVAPFKVGPDYIDPSLLAQAARRPCHNLDAWMLGEAGVCDLFIRNTRDCDIAVIEGVMGLFDGVAGEDNFGSTAHIARLLCAPILLVLDASAMSRTAAAIAKGLADFDRSLNVVGVIFNRVGGPTHAAMLRQALADTGLACLGALPRANALARPERHLGLVHAAEQDLGDWLAALREQIEEAIDLSALRAMLSPSPAQCDVAPTVAFPSRSDPVDIAVARDEAFSFTYPDNLALLEAAGARLIFFSPLRDSTLPERAGALLLSGGFPELYAAQLAENVQLRAAIARAAADGMPIYAECGGLMFLCESLVDQNGDAHPMCGVLPGRSVMTTRLTLGYRHARALRDSWLWRAGETIRGHEFHYSTWEAPAAAAQPVYELLPTHYQPASRLEGAQVGQVIASYVHLHFLAKPALAERFVQAARAWVNRQP